MSGTGSATDQGPYVEALRQGLRSLDQVEGRNFSIEYRGAEGKLDRIPTIVSELVQLKVAVIVAPIASAIRSAQEATRTIPIVMVTGLDPVGNGFVDSLARPGGNITGVATRTQDLNAKRLELLNEIVPRLSHVAVLWTSDNSVAAMNFREYEAAASALKIQLQSLEVQLENPDIESAFRSAGSARANALITITSAPLFPLRRRIAELAMKYRLPTMFPGSAWVQSDGLMSYSTNDLEAFRIAATYVDRILKGAKPADLPVEQLAKFELAINLRTARAIGLAIPQSVLVRADQVIR